MPATHPDYLRKILTARVYDVARESELDFAPNLSARLHNRVYLKREDNQTVFSFKLRGAYNKMVQLSPEQRARGAFTASAGNHAQGVALAARRLDMRALIVMPVTTPAVKIDAVKAHGGDAVEVLLVGESYSDAYRAALQIGAERSLTLVHPFDDADVIAGQGTVAMEVLRQHEGPIHAIFAPVGGGGLIAGMAAYIKAVRPEIKVIGVQTEDSDAMAQSLAAGHRIELRDVGLFSDGTAVKMVGAETFRVCQQHVDEILRVDTDALCAAIKDAFAENRSMLEPAGALAIAGAKLYVEREQLRDETLIAIASGANLNFDRLRFVAERAEVGESREVLFAVTVPEERGSFRRFCSLLGTHSITEFNYRIGDSKQARLFVGIQTRNRHEAAAIVSAISAGGFDVLDLTHDELAKLHLRHMVGGRGDLASDELLYQFDFPERPGALARFLDALDPAWNISLFHYRNHGADYARILVGIQVPTQDRSSFQDFLERLGYAHRDESTNPAYRLLLRGG